MPKRKLPEIRLVPSTPDGPTAPTTMGSEAAHNERPSGTPKQGLMPRPSLSQLIEQKYRENHHLRQQLEDQQEKERKIHGAKMHIVGSVRETVVSLQDALEKFDQLYMELQDDLKEGN